MFLVRPQDSCHTPSLADDEPVSLITEYVWTEVEAATAIICACLVTYRPLFINISQSVSKVSSLFCKSNSMSKRATQDDWKPLEDATDSQLQWPIGKDSHGRDVLRFQDLNAKATKDMLHAVNIHPLKTDSKPTRSLDVADAQDKGNISSHHPVLFPVTEEQVVNPFSYR